MNRLAAPAVASGCIDLSAVQSASQSSSDEAGLRRFIKSELSAADERLADRFWAGDDVAELVRARAWAVEQLVLLAWKHCVADRLEGQVDSPCLVAVGGFGRGELHPHSDAICRHFFPKRRKPFLQMKPALLLPAIQIRL
jgi:hypothetical protein